TLNSTLSIGANSITSTGSGTTMIFGAITGSGAINANGPGTLWLSGNSTGYTGTITLNSGILRANATSNAIGAGAIVVNGGELQLAGTFNNTRSVTVNANATFKSDQNSSSAGSSQTLGTLQVNGSTMTVTAGSFVNSGTASYVFGATTLTGNTVF